MFFIILLSSFTVLLVGLYVKGAYNYWAVKKAPHINGSFPFGSRPNIQFSTDYLGYDVKRHYEKLAPHPFGGIYHFTKPQLVMRDPDLIRLVLVKDFSYFQSRTSLTSPNSSALSRNLFSLEGDLWKSLRIKLTPTFTSGKLKNMTGIFEDCSRQLVNLLSRQEMTISDKSRNNDGVVVNVKDTIARFTTDVIVSAAFGLESHSLDDSNSPFLEIGRRVVTTDKTLYRNIVNALLEYFPGTRRFFRTADFKETEKFMVDSIRRTIEYRENQNVKRNDFLNLLIELKNKKKDKSSETLSTCEPEIEMDLFTIVAQCFIFFIAGFETSSSVQTFALYLLAMHQDIQDKLRTEMNEVMNKYGGKSIYEAFQEMPFLDQVINETMRIYPTLPMTTRVCTKDYAIPGTEVVIERGTKIIIPVYALHHDPKHFPDPETFDPDRFSKSNERFITPYTFLPFGEGPRHCIGMRFGLLQTKFGLFSILTNYKITPCNETEIPLKLRSSNLLTLTRNAIKLKFEKL